MSQPRRVYQDGAAWKSAVINDIRSVLMSVDTGNPEDRVWLSEMIAAVNLAAKGLNRRRVSVLRQRHMACRNYTKIGKSLKVSSARARELDIDSRERIWGRLMSWMMEDSELRALAFKAAGKTI